MTTMGYACACSISVQRRSVAAQTPSDRNVVASGLLGPGLPLGCLTCNLRKAGSGGRTPRSDAMHAVHKTPPTDLIRGRPHRANPRSIEAASSPRWPPDFADYFSAGGYRRRGRGILNGTRIRASRRRSVVRMATRKVPMASRS